MNDVADNPHGAEPAAQDLPRFSRKPRRCPEDTSLPTGVSRARYPSRRGYYQVRIYDWRVGDVVASRYFADLKHGGEAGARAAALAWHDAESARLAIPPHPDKRIRVQDVRSTTDLVGVRMEARIRDNASIALNWQGKWFDGERQHKKTFALRVYGYSGGFWRAVALRLRHIAWVPDWPVRVPAPRPEDVALLVAADVSWRSEVGQDCPPAWPGDGASWLAALAQMGDADLDHWLGAPIPWTRVRR